MRVLVCGGRDYQDAKYVNNRLSALHAKHGITLLIEGGAPGADTLAGEWADDNGIPHCTMRANWGFHRKAAGPIRNKDMLELLTPDIVVAFPGGDGTENMVSQAKTAENVKIWDLRQP